MPELTLEQATALCAQYNRMAQLYETQATTRYPNIEWKIPRAKPQYVLSGDHGWVSKGKFLARTNICLNGQSVGVNTWLEWEQLRTLDLMRCVGIAAEALVAEVMQALYGEEPL